MVSMFGRGFDSRQLHDDTVHINAKTCKLNTYRFFYFYPCAENSLFVQILGYLFGSFLMKVFDSRFKAYCTVLQHFAL